MTELEALQCLAALTLFDHRTWDDDKVEAWTRVFATHGDYQAGMKASEALVTTKHPRDWSIAAWREAYMQSHRGEPVALPASRHDINAVTLAEHIEALEAAETPEAKAELAIWRKHRGSGGMIGRRL